jgi:hypothetical protein
LRPEKTPARTVNISGTRMLHLEGPLVILEFEVPEAGFLLPGDGTTVRVRFEDGSDCRAKVLGKESSRPGPHEKGLTIRIAVKLAHRYFWHGREAWLRWTGHVQPLYADAEPVEIEMHVVLAERP